MFKNYIPTHFTFLDDKIKNYLPSVIKIKFIYSRGNDVLML